MTIRIATIKDIDGIVNVHVNSWKTTYKGIISPTYLSRISSNDRKTRWESTFANLKEDEIIYVIEEHGKVLGFLNGGRSRGSEEGIETEIYSLYLLEEAQGKGYGKILISNFMKHISSKSYRNTMVWVLENNASIEFYKKLGGQEIRKQQITIGEETFIEVALGWKDINTEG
jgi:L-amino acid N-acyltransferase YncA